MVADHWLSSQTNSTGRRKAESLNWAAVQRPVAEEGDRDRVAPLDRHRVRGTHRDRDAGRDDAVGAQHADREVGDVHRAALAAAEAAGLAEQLVHHPFEAGALGQRVAVTAVRRGQPVRGGQVRADAGRHRFLSGRQVQRPAHLRGRTGRLAEHRDAAAAGLLGRILEGPDPAHRPVKREQLPAVGPGNAGPATFVQLPGGDDLHRCRDLPRKVV